MATKRLNLSASNAAPAKKTKSKAAAAAAPQSSASSTASNSSDDEEARAATSEPEQDDESDDESDEEFEIPPGFEPVKGSSAITRDAVLSDDKELWFFKLPKDMDASALANVSFKLGKHTALGDAVANLSRDGKAFRLQNEDVAIAQQLVNAFPQAADRKRFTLAKPFARVFSLVEDRAIAAHNAIAVVAASPSIAKQDKSNNKRNVAATIANVVEATNATSPVAKKSKKSKSDGKKSKK